MNKYDAAKILNLSGDLNPSIIKKAYRLACSKYHPDRNPAGSEMMKAINLAYEVLKDFTGNIEDNREFNTNDNQSFADSLNSILNKIIGLEGIEIEITGAWVWVSGDTKKHKEKLKEYGFKWASKKKLWFHSNGVKSKSKGGFSMDDIREKHGSQSVKRKTNKYKSIAA